MATKRHSTTGIPTDGKCIRYDRETKDYACYLNGEFIGYAANYSAGEQLCNEVYYAQLTTPAPRQNRRHPTPGQLDYWALWRVPCCADAPDGTPPRGVKLCETPIATG